MSEGIVHHAPSPARHEDGNTTSLTGRQQRRKLRKGRNVTTENGTSKLMRNEPKGSRDPEEVIESEDQRDDSRTRSSLSEWRKEHRSAPSPIRNRPTSSEQRDPNPKYSQERRSTSSPYRDTTSSTLQKDDPSKYKRTSISEYIKDRKLAQSKIGIRPASASSKESKSASSPPSSASQKGNISKRNNSLDQQSGRRTPISDSSRDRRSAPSPVANRRASALKKDNLSKRNDLVQQPNDRHTSVSSNSKERRSTPLSTRKTTSSALKQDDFPERDGIRTRNRSTSKLKNEDVSNRNDPPYKTNGRRTANSEYSREHRLSPSPGRSRPSSAFHTDKNISQRSDPSDQKSRRRVANHEYTKERRSAQSLTGTSSRYESFTKQGDTVTPDSEHSKLRRIAALQIKKRPSSALQKDNISRVFDPFEKLKRLDHSNSGNNNEHQSAASPIRQRSTSTSRGVNVSSRSDSFNQRDDRPILNSEAGRDHRQDPSPIMQRPVSRGEKLSRVFDPFERQRDGRQISHPENMRGTRMDSSPIERRPVLSSPEVGGGRSVSGKMQNISPRNAFGQDNGMEGSMKNRPDFPSPKFGNDQRRLSNPRYEKDNVQNMPSSPLRQGGRGRGGQSSKVHWYNDRGTSDEGTDRHTESVEESSYDVESNSIDSVKTEDKDEERVKNRPVREESFYDKVNEQMENLDHKTHRMLVVLESLHVLHILCHLHMCCC